MDVYWCRGNLETSIKCIVLYRPRSRTLQGERGLRLPIVLHLALFLTKALWLHYINTRLVLDDLRCEGAKHALSIPQLLSKHSKEMQFKRDDLPQQHTGKLIKHDIEPASSVQSSLCPLQATLQALTLHFIHILCPWVTSH